MKTTFFSLFASVILVITAMSSCEEPTLRIKQVTIPVSIDYTKPVDSLVESYGVVNKKVFLLDTSIPLAMNNKVHTEVTLLQFNLPMDKSTLESIMDSMGLRSAVNIYEILASDSALQMKNVFDLKNQKLVASAAPQHQQPMNELSVYTIWYNEYNEHIVGLMPPMGGFFEPGTIFVTFKKQRT